MFKKFKKNWLDFNMSWLTVMRLVLLILLFSPQLIIGGQNNNNNSTKRSVSNMVKKLHAPSIIDPRTDKLMLRCEYDLHGNELYSVNWYRNEEVLFRYSPSLIPKATVFNTKSDVNVSLEHSNAEQLLLIGHKDPHKNLHAYIGTYLCEVSTERPFLTDYGIANVSAAILPKSNPVLEGLRHNYQVGELLEVSCTSAPSLPPAEITFYLNGRKMDKSRIQSDKMVQPLGELTSSTRAKLSIKLERQHFPSGSIKVTCVGHLPNVTSTRDYRSEDIATLGANNQRLAQEPPSISCASTFFFKLKFIFIYFLLLVLYFIL